MQSRQLEDEDVFMSDTPSKGPLPSESGVSAGDSAPALDPTFRGLATVDWESDLRAAVLERVPLVIDNLQYLKSRLVNHHKNQQSAHSAPVGLGKKRMRILCEQLRACVKCVQACRDFLGLCAEIGSPALEYYLDERKSEASGTLWDVIPGNLAAAFQALARLAQPLAELLCMQSDFVYRLLVRENGVVVSGQHSASESKPRQPRRNQIPSEVWTLLESLTGRQTMMEQGKLALDRLHDLFMNPDTLDLARQLSERQRSAVSFPELRAEVDRQRSLVDSVMPALGILVEYKICGLRYLVPKAGFGSDMETVNRYPDSSPASLLSLQMPQYLKIMMQLQPPSPHPSPPGLSFPTQPLPEHLEFLSRDMEWLWSNARVSQRTSELRRKRVAEIQNAVHSLWRSPPNSPTKFGGLVEIYGSCASGMDVSTSDLDLTVTLYGFQNSQQRAPSGVLSKPRFSGQGNGASAEAGEKGKLNSETGFVVPRARQLALLGELAKTLHERGVLSSPPDLSVLQKHSKLPSSQERKVSLSENDDGKESSHTYAAKLVSSRVPVLRLPWSAFSDQSDSSQQPESKANDHSGHFSIDLRITDAVSPSSDYPEILEQSPASPPQSMSSNVCKALLFRAILLDISKRLQNRLGQRSEDVSAIHPLILAFLNTVGTFGKRLGLIGRGRFNSFCFQLMGVAILLRWLASPSSADLKPSQLIGSWFWDFCVWYSGIGALHSSSSQKDQASGAQPSFDPDLQALDIHSISADLGSCCTFPRGNSDRASLSSRRAAQKDTPPDRKPWWNPEYLQEHSPQPLNPMLYPFQHSSNQRLARLRPKLLIIDPFSTPEAPDNPARVVNRHDWRAFRRACLRSMLCLTLLQPWLLPLSSEGAPGSARMNVLGLILRNFPGHPILMSRDGKMRITQLLYR